MEAQQTQTVQVNLFDDLENIRSTIKVDLPLAALFSYAHQWAQKQKPQDKPTLTFPSFLAAMMASDGPLCKWLRSHLALRGVRREWMTYGLEFDPKPLPKLLNTSSSFREALAEAQRLCPNHEQEGLAVRYFMAAYAVIPYYHPADFLRLRIDRRDWCIELAEHLAMTFPTEESMWQEYAKRAPDIQLLSYNTDAPEGRDLLNLDREIEAFARLIASRSSATPLSVGVFGAWGSGKSFFMRRLRRRVESLAKRGCSEGAGSKYHGQIAQIEFNAWHYSEGNLAASFVAHILRNLRVNTNEDEEELKKRSEALIMQLDSAKQELAVRQNAVVEAEAKSKQAEKELIELDAKIADEMEKKQQEIEEARSKLQRSQEEITSQIAALQQDIEARVRQLQVAAVGSQVIASLNSPELSQATESIRGLINDVQETNRNRQLIFYGLIAVMIAGASAVIVAAIRQSEFYVQLTVVATAAGGLAVAATPWIKKLNEFAKKGQELLDKQQQIKAQAEKEIMAAHDKAVEKLQKEAENQQSILTALTEQLEKIKQAPTTDRLALGDLERQRAVALEQQIQAVKLVEAKQAELARLSTGTLLDEFLNDRASQEGYLKELTLFTRIRTDFERLSALMTKTHDEYVKDKDKKPPPPAPTVSRIVLYIDDLDRCPADKVVDVLKLVHLLLAFPLFICVVAVDPRWITRCLQQAPGLDEASNVKASNVGAGNIDLTDHDRELEETAVGAPATATDYLEKIFQIPLWLRPVPTDQRAAIVRTLLDPTESLDELHYEQLEPALPALVMPKSENPLPDGDLPRKMPSDKAVITAEELLYLDHLGDLLNGNPRSLKRFVNTYRLVKTALSEAEYAEFASTTIDATSYQPYQLCMAMLAILCTQRNRALRLVKSADGEEDARLMREWLTEFGKTDADLAKRFGDALNSNFDRVEMSIFKVWLERTRRYSFYV